jgi:hypothetical protein
MKKIIHILLIASVSLIATGCLNLTEEITLNSNGSGNYVISMDVTKLMEQMNTFSAFDSTGQMVPNMERSFDSTYDEMVKKYQDISGVSDVQLDKRVKNIYKVSLRFSDIKALNAVVDIDKKGNTQKELYSWSKGKLSRKDGGVTIATDFLNGDADNKEMMEVYLADTKYNLIYHLPGAVKKMTNNRAVLSDGKKTVTLETAFGDLNKSGSLINAVKY